MRVLRLKLHIYPPYGPDLAEGHVCFTMASLGWLLELAVNKFFTSWASSTAGGALPVGVLSRTEAVSMK